MEAADRVLCHSYLSGRRHDDQELMRRAKGRHNEVSGHVCLRGGSGSMLNNGL